MSSTAVATATCVLLVIPAPTAVDALRDRYAPGVERGEERWSSVPSPTNLSRPANLHGPHQSSVQACVLAPSRSQHVGAEPAASQHGLPLSTASPRCAAPHTALRPNPPPACRPLPIHSAMRLQFNVVAARALLRSRDLAQAKARQGVVVVPHTSSREGDEGGSGEGGEAGVGGQCAPRCAPLRVLCAGELDHLRTCLGFCHAASVCASHSPGCLPAVWGAQSTRALLFPTTTTTTTTCLCAHRCFSRRRGRESPRAPADGVSVPGPDQHAADVGD